MKKILSTILVAVLLVGCVFALASCSPKSQGEKPEFDLKKAAENLEDEDYTVSHVDDKDSLEAYIEERLYAYDKEDYNSITIVVFKDSKTAKLYYEKQVKSIQESIDYNEDQIEYYEHILKEYESKLESKEIDGLEDKIKEYKEQIEEYKEDYCYGIDDCTVWYGSADAVKDSK